MGIGSDKLSDLIAEIWDRSHHIFPKSAGMQKILRWLIHTDDLLIFEEEPLSTDEAPYPALWASGSFNSNENIRWGGGVWS